MANHRELDSKQFHDQREHDSDRTAAEDPDKTTIDTTAIGQWNLQKAYNDRNPSIVHLETLLTQS